MNSLIPWVENVRLSSDIAIAYSRLTVCESFDYLICKLICISDFLDYNSLIVYNHVIGAEPMNNLNYFSL